MNSNSKEYSLPQMSKKQFFRHLLEILSVFNPVKQLTGSEKDLVCLIMYYTDKYSNKIDPLTSQKFDYGRLAEIVLDTSHRKIMREELKWNMSTFNNCIYNLRKKKVLDDKGILSKFYRVRPNIEYNLMFKYTIK